MYILGLSAFYHDSAACLLQDGRIIAAAQEERFTRKKHDASFPDHAIAYCLAEAGIIPEQIDQVVFYEKPFLKFERLLETYLAFAPRGFRSFALSMPAWIKDKLFQKSVLTKALSNALGETIDWQSRLLFSQHHLSHAASAFYPLALRTRGGPHPGWRRRVDDELACGWPRQPSNDSQRNSLSAFSRLTLLGVYLLHRF